MRSELYKIVIKENITISKNIAALYKIVIKENITISKNIEIIKLKNYIRKVPWQAFLSFSSINPE